MSSHGSFETWGRPALWPRSWAMLRDRTPLSSASRETTKASPSTFAQPMIEVLKLLQYQTD
jgi:hypothetical protein